MIGVAAKLSRTATAAARASRWGPNCLVSHLASPSSYLFRLQHDGTNGSSTAKPVALQMINYAISHARSQKSDESYAQGMLVLEQCLSTQSVDDQNSRAVVLLAMSTLLYERGRFDEAIENLQGVLEIDHSSLAVKVASMEALIGISLEMGQDDTSSFLADKCLKLLEKDEPDCASGVFNFFHARAEAVKGLVELIHGNLQSAGQYFQDSPDSEVCKGSVALSYGEYLHAKQDLLSAKELYQKVINEISNNQEYEDPYSLAACNMSSNDVFLAAICALGQLESHLGNFEEAEKLLTRALTRAEKHFGSDHLKVGVVLTCIGLMFKRKAMQERSSFLLIQEGLYRRAIGFLQAGPLDKDGAEANVERRDIVALARGAYAEALCVQQSRKDEGEKMKKWALAAWRNSRLSLAEALEIAEPSSKVPIIDTRTSRVI